MRWRAWLVWVPGCFCVVSLASVASALCALHGSVGRFLRVVPVVPVVGGRVRVVCVSGDPWDNGGGETMTLAMDGRYILELRRIHGSPQEEAQEE